MGNEVEKKFTWVIKNFSSLQSEKIYSDKFVISGCKWRLLACPRENNNPNHMSLYLIAADSKYLPSGWRRDVLFSLTVVNQSSEKFSKAIESRHCFDQKEDEWGFESMFPLSRIKAKHSGFLVNGELKIVAKVDVLQVIGKLDVSDLEDSLSDLEDSLSDSEGSLSDSEEPEVISCPIKRRKPNADDAVSSNLVKEALADFVDVNGFQVPPSQVDFAKRVFERHPEIALECRTKNQDLRTSYMNVLLSLIKMLFRWPQEHSKDDISDAEAALASMKSVGFKLDWLEKKLDQVKENKKKFDRVCEMEQELLDLKQKCKDLETQLDREMDEILEATSPDPSFSDVV